MKALTVWQPWASLIVGSTDTPPQKPVENRDWRPPASLVGQRIAIHAGRKMDDDAAYEIFKSKAFGSVAPPYRTLALFPLGAVVGVATLDRVIGPCRDVSIFFERRFERVPQPTIDSWGLGDELRWYMGSLGWVFRDQIALAAPVTVKGAQGLWTLPSDVERRVVEQLGERAA